MLTVSIHRHDHIRTKRLTCAKAGPGGSSNTQVNDVTDDNRAGVFGDAGSLIRRTVIDDQLENFQVIKVRRNVGHNVPNRSCFVVGG